MIIIRGASSWKRFAAIVVFVCSTLPLGAHALAQVQDEHVIATTNLLKPASTSPESVCANFVSESIVTCVYMDWGGTATRVNLYEIASRDGGVSWTAPIAITNSPGDEYGPYISYDSKRKRLWLAYSKWHNDKGGAHNDLLVSHKDCGGCAWSSPSIIAGDGANDYWIPSILVLKDQSILVFYTKNGPESPQGVGSGTIELRRSEDGGGTWGDAIRPIKLCDVEYGRAIQNSFGSILLVFGRYADSSHLPKGTTCSDATKNGYPIADIHQIWSPDGGRTWKGDSVLYHTENGAALHPFIGAEQADPGVPCPKCAWQILFVQTSGHSEFAVFRLKSVDQGINWGEPTRYSPSAWSSPFNVDPGFVVGCRGELVNYTSGYGSDKVYVRLVEKNKISTCPIR